MSNGEDTDNGGYFGCDRQLQPCASDWDRYPTGGFPNLPASHHQQVADDYFTDCLVSAYEKNAEDIVLKNQRTLA